MLKKTNKQLVLVRRFRKMLQNLQNDSSITEDKIKEQGRFLEKIEGFCTEIQAQIGQMISENNF